jgi:hypothetical protein
MKINVGGLDRNLRMVLGAGALIAAISSRLPRGWRLGLLSFAIGELVTTATQHCPINRALGINTNPTKIKKATCAAVGVVRALAI